MSHPIVTEVIRICQLRGAPQNLPVAPALAVGLLALAQAVGLVNAAQLGAGSRNVATAVGSLLFALLATRVVLQMRGKPERFWQTLLALAGTSLVFALLAFPLSALIGPLPPLDPANPAPLPVPAPLLLLIVVLGGWRLLVSGHIWRHALEVPLPVGVLVVLALFVTELVLLATLLAGAGAVPDNAGGMAGALP